MIYGNTVDHRAGNWARNTATVTAQLSCDIALQIRRPTGHAINPVPLTEAERIPSADEIVQVHLLAREVEREVRKAPNLFDWDRLERLGALMAQYAREFRDRALAGFSRDGIDVTDAAQVLLAMRRTSMTELEQLVDLAAPMDVERLEPWKSSHVRSLTEALTGNDVRLDGKRVVLAVSLPLSQRARSLSHGSLAASSLPSVTSRLSLA